ncbi:hypothetical protein [Bradyrhizobium sp. AS23.2]|uniref:hypothetical protein n=1 Tax=Bradyrhizobium sp. AS23.2 TaxID=1680155 RepID=UPI00095A7A39|nr:hypothetical protein [Bradyrhizobium sp. AS23.2]OKO87465.1 hypothetical protein AC630_00115 [Bradyrhizobium sp. AS23.2]
MTTSPKRRGISPIATNDRSAPATSPRIKLYKRRIAIDHPDPQAGERLLADALGAVDRDALHGILKQLVKASAIGQRPDEANLAFMISMMKSIAPRDSIEAMLAAQMVCVHVTAMRCAHHLACAGDLASQDSASRALAKLARIFPAQVEALGRYRNNGERAITVQSVPALDGGEAIAGNVAQHASMIVAETNAAGTTMHAGTTLAPVARQNEQKQVEATPGVRA